jgi:hypothetical protein
MTGLIRLRSSWPAAVTAALLLALASPAVAREEIRSYDSAVTLAANGTVDIVETIAVNAEGTEIKHGIYRDIPTEFTDFAKVAVTSDLAVLDVTRDGVAEPFIVLDRPAGFKRVRIGSADVTVSNGVHSYVIHYTMTRIGRAYADHDELLWNVTGNEWSFPILKTSANVMLPSGARISGAVGYIVSPAAQQDVQLQGSTPAQMSFAVTRTLEPGEGLTVGVMFQKGTLALPESTDSQIDKVENR